MVDIFGTVRAFGPRALAIGTLLVLGATAGDAWATEPAPGAPALERARGAWDRGALKTAEPLYREALEKGGLSPSEVLEGYVRLGSIRAVLGKKTSAVAAFRAASVLDADFAVPKRAGRKGAALAEQAKRDTEKIGSLQLALEAPKEAETGKPFTVKATLDKAHLPIVSRIGLHAKDGTTGKEVSFDAETGETVDLEIGPDLTLPGASIVVRVDALDKSKNRLASVEERVRVPDAQPVAAPVAGVTEPTRAAPQPGGDSGVRRGGGFWSSPWPYVIGGIALAGAGAAIFIGTRPVDTVSVGPVGVREQ